MFLRWGEADSTCYVGHCLSYCTSPGCWMINVEHQWNDSQGKPKYLEKTSARAIVSTTNHKRPYPGSNTDRRGGKTVTNRLRYGTTRPTIISSGTCSE
jgi:hypothetical protein